MNKMDFVSAELKSINEDQDLPADVERITCVPAMVRFNIFKTNHKNLVACFQFPKNYPNQSIIIELKSKVFSEKLLSGLTNMCELECKRILGQRQIMFVVRYLVKFLEDNPLCVCSEEISFIKKNLLNNESEMKLRQKSSQIFLKIQCKKYFIQVKVKVPDIYPESQIELQITDHNFPELLKVNCEAQAIEIGRQCVTPPLKVNPKAPPFKKRCSLLPIVEYFTRDIVWKVPLEKCPICQEQALPLDPAHCVHDSAHDMYVERVYCRHLFHHKCLDHYMKAPPFTGGKKCPKCGNRIFHEKWHATPELAEARWAHKEARDRELDEVFDFLQ